MLLFTPGPTPVPESVRNAMGAPTIHHRTPEFEAIFEKARTLLFKLYGMHEVLMLASSGTGAMEACLTNLCQHKALTINAGKFGERFGKICAAQGISYEELKYDWNTPANLEDILAALKADKSIDAIAIQVCESAGGLRHPVEAIAKAVKELNPAINVIADGITAVGVEKLDTTHIDALISGSQKALMLPPGLATIGLSEAAITKIGAGKGYYFNLASEVKKQKQNTTAYTAATTLIIGLVAVLEEMDALGFDTLYKQTHKRSLATKKALETIGLRNFPQVAADSMTTIISEHANEIRKLLKTKYDVNVAGGQDHLKGKIFRINHMGLIKPYEASWVVNAIELALDELGVRTYDGSANKIFSEIYFKEEQ